MLNKKRLNPVGVLSVFLPTLLCAFLFFHTAILAQSASDYQTTQNAKVETSNAGLTVKVAPGEILPISVKLFNFGGGKRVDVLVEYGIFNSRGEEIYAANETVAVETTASFIKTIQISPNTSPGKYVAKTSITYQGQLVPATTQFPFLVENKILGLFQGDFFLYAGLTIIVSILIVASVALLAKRRRSGRYATFIPFDYSNVPRDQRVFFELLSDTIMQMRLRVGDAALDVATHIEGLKIDEKTGRVLSLTQSPSRVIALLVSGYEKALGQKVSFSFRNAQ